MALRRKTTRKKFNRQRFYNRTTKRLAEVAYRRARVNIPSQTLQDGMVILKVKSNRRRAVYKLFIPHYWATYIHDGRSTVRPRRKKFLVWFKDPKNDPRYFGGYPVRLADAKSLEMTRAQIKRKRSDMIFSKSAKPIRGKYFFSNKRGMRSFSQWEVPKIVKDELRMAVNEFVGKQLMDQNVKHRF